MINYVPDFDAIDPDHHDLVYLLFGYSNYHKDTTVEDVPLNTRLRNILEELVSSYKAESILYDDLDGYMTLKSLLRHGITPTIKDWSNKDLLAYFVCKFESIQDSNYLEIEVYYFLKSLKLECDKFFTPIEKTKYYKYGRDSNG